MKKMKQENECLEIRLHQLIDNGEENEAIKLIDENKDIDINYEYNDRILVLSAINNKMFDLFVKIINHPKFNSNIKDAFSETLLETLIYLYGSDDISESKDNEDLCKRMIEAILKLDSYDFNCKDLNEDTAINIACEYPKMLWIVEALAAKENVDINIVNDFDCAALGNAIRNKNLEAIKILSKRKDLNVRVADVEMAKKYNVDLSEYGIEIAKKLKKAHDYAFKTV